MTNKNNNSDSHDHPISEMMSLEIIDQVNIFTCQQMTNYLDQDLKLNTLESMLTNGSFGDDDE